MVTNIMSEVKYMYQHIHFHRAELQNSAVFIFLLTANMRKHNLVITIVVGVSMTHNLKKKVKIEYR